MSSSNRLQPPPSRSAIIAQSMSGSHILTIQGYSLTNSLGFASKCITSKPFLAGGHWWCLQYYPHGKTPHGGISIHLQLESTVTAAVRAKFKISLLDQYENPVPSYVRGRDAFYTFSGKGTSHGEDKFISKDDLERSPHLRDDTFSIKCDITVMEEIKIEDIPTTSAVDQRRRGF